MQYFGPLAPGVATAGGGTTVSVTGGLATVNRHSDLRGIASPKEDDLVYVERATGDFLTGNRAGIYRYTGSVWEYSLKDSTSYLATRKTEVDTLKTDVGNLKTKETTNTTNITTNKNDITSLKNNEPSVITDFDDDKDYALMEQLTAGYYWIRKLSDGTEAYKSENGDKTKADLWNDRETLTYEAIDVSKRGV